MLIAAHKYSFSSLDRLIARILNLNKSTFISIIIAMDDNFYATTLDSTNKTVKWDVVGDTKEFPNPFYKLIVRQFLLGHTAKEGEYNVVEVETSSMSESKPNQVKVPVAVLKAGETRSIQTVMEFPDPPVSFKLVEGSGPVYIHGQQVPGNYEIEDNTELSGEEEEEDDEEEVKVANSKAKTAKNGKKN